MNQTDTEERAAAKATIASVNADNLLEVVEKLTQWPAYTNQWTKLALWCARRNWGPTAHLVKSAEDSLLYADWHATMPSAITEQRRKNIQLALEASRRAETRKLAEDLILSAEYRTLEQRASHMEEIAVAMHAVDAAYHNFTGDWFAATQAVQSCIRSAIEASRHRPFQVDADGMGHPVPQTREEGLQLQRETCEQIADFLKASFAP